MEKDLALIKYVAEKNKLGEIVPTRFKSGQINRVYDLGQAVIKIEGSDQTNYAKGVLHPQATLINQLVEMGAKIPAVLDHGDFEGHPYILMEKAPGKNIVYEWLNMDSNQKEKIIAQVCEQLQIFHHLEFDSYCLPIYQGKKFKNLKDAFSNVVNFKLIDKTKLKKEYLEDVELLEEFFAKNINILDEKNTAVLVHSDIHLENIFHEGDKLTAIIDFDWITAAPKDYELWKITDVFYDPKKTAEKGLESLYQGYRMTEELKFIKKYYPELFASANLLTRVRLFHIENMVYIHLYNACTEGGTLNFWRTKSGAEVDFILRLQGNLIPVEVKYFLFQSCKGSRSFSSFIESFKPQRGVVLTKNFWGKMKMNGTETMLAPVYYL